jgi:hypothetical protein
LLQKRFAEPLRFIHYPCSSINTKLKRHYKRKPLPDERESGTDGTDLTLEQPRFKGIQSVQAFRFPFNQ